MLSNPWTFMEARKKSFGSLYVAYYALCTNLFSGPQNYWRTRVLWDNHNEFFFLDCTQSNSKAMRRNRSLSFTGPREIFGMTLLAAATRDRRKEHVTAIEVCRGHPGPSSRGARRRSGASFLTSFHRSSVDAARSGPDFRVSGAHDGAAARQSAQRALEGAVRVSGE